MLLLWVLLDKWVLSNWSLRIYIPSRPESQARQESATPKTQASRDRNDRVERETKTPHTTSCSIIVCWNDVTRLNGAGPKYLRLWVLLLSAFGLPVRHNMQFITTNHRWRCWSMKKRREEEPPFHRRTMATRIFVRFFCVCCPARACPTLCDFCIEFVECGPPEPNTQKNDDDHQIIYVFGYGLYRRPSTWVRWVNVFFCLLCVFGFIRQSMAHWRHCTVRYAI